MGGRRRGWTVGWKESEFRGKEGLRRGEKITCFYCPGFGSFGFRKVGRDVGTFSVCDETRCFLNVR